MLWFYFYIITSPAMKALIALFKDIDYTFHINNTVFWLIIF